MTSALTVSVPCMRSQTEVVVDGLGLSRRVSRLTPSAIVALAIVYVVWGSTYLAIRYVVASLPPYISAGARFLIAGVVLYPIALYGSGRPQRVADRPTARHWRSALVIGGLLLAIGNGGVSEAEQHVASGTAALLVGMVPLWMAIFGWLFFRERVTAWAVVGLLVGFSGVAMLAGGEHSGGVSASGLLTLVVATLAWSGGSIFARSAPMPARPLLGTAMEMIAGGAACLVVGSVLGEWADVRLSRAHASAWIGLAYLIVFGSIVAYSAYTWLLRSVSTPIVSTYAYVNPAVAVLLGWLVAGEQITGRTLAAAAVIIAGVALIVSGPRLAGRRQTE